MCPQDTLLWGGVIGKNKYEYWLTQDGQTLLRGWMRNGLSEEQIACKCGVTVGTFQKWKNRFPQISEALGRGRELVDIEVENALLKRALGFIHIERQTVIRKKIEYNENGKKEREISEPVVVEVEHYHPPDVRAQLYWLKNRCPEVWRDKQIADSENDIPLEVTLSDEAREYLV